LTSQITTPPASEAAIQQINLSYDIAQDRLLLRVGLNDDTELLVWLTQRMSNTLWQLLNAETALPTATSIEKDAPPQSAVAQFKQEAKASESLQKMDFASEYQPRKTVRNDQIMLATSVLMMTYSNKAPSLELPCLEGVTIRMNLTPELILALCSMLQRTTRESGWQFNAALPNVGVINVQVETTKDKKVLH
jgi:hypothetical protein